MVVKPENRNLRNGARRSVRRSGSPEEVAHPARTGGAELAHTQHGDVVDGNWPVGGARAAICRGQSGNRGEAAGSPVGHRRSEEDRPVGGVQDHLAEIVEAGGAAEPAVGIQSSRCDVR